MLLELVLILFLIELFILLVVLVGGAYNYDDTVLSLMVWQTQCARVLMVLADTVC